MNKMETDMMQQPSVVNTLQKKKYKSIRQTSPDEEMVGESWSTQVVSASSRTGGEILTRKVTV